MIKNITFFILVSIASISSGQVSSVPDCEIDEDRDYAYRVADLMVEETIATLNDKPEPSEAACLPMLKELGNSISLEIPGYFDMSSMLSKFKDAACTAANSALEGLASNMAIQVEAPYGMGGARAGITTKAESWREVEIERSNKNYLDFLEREATKIGTQTGRDTVNNLKSIQETTRDFNSEAARQKRLRDLELRRAIDEKISN